MLNSSSDVCIYSILDYHRLLYASTPHSEFGGHFRRGPAYLKNASIELCSWQYIWQLVKELDLPVRELIKNGSKIKNNMSIDKLIDYLENCITIKCTLIKIHPFADGNGRTIRCFLNKLFGIAGIPPVYIKEKEREEYHVAMQQAIAENSYEPIIQFYYYKICDSIVELDINERLKEEKTKSL